MNEEIYEGTPAKEDILIGTDSGYNRYRRPDGSTYVHYPYNRMATVTAYSAKDKNGRPIHTADGKLITGKTQAEADRNRFRYDMNHWVEANRRKTAHLPEGWRERIVTPDMNTFNAITGGVFNLTPIQVGRGIYNLSQGKDPGFILGNSGVVSEEYAQEHPWLALGANVLGEGLTGGFIYGAPKLYNAGVRGIKNYRMARAFDNIVRSEIKKKDWFNKNFPLYTYKPQPYNNRLGLPESDPNTFYHYMYYPSPININGEGVVRFSNFTIKPKYNGLNERIWWDKGNVPTGDVVLSSKSKYIDEHVLSHPEKYSPYRGYYEDSYYTSGDVPINEVGIYTKNPFTGYYDGPHNTITYNPPKLIEGKTALTFFERSPLNINPKGSWTYPFKNNMGLLNHRTSSVTGNNFGDFIAEGSEQMVFNNPNSINEVLKIYSDVGQSSLNNLRKFVKLYQTRNNVPFLLPTTFVGHVSDKNGLLYPVFSQQKILKTLQSDMLDWNTNILPRLNTLMKSVGFNGNGYYRRGTQEIGDIHSFNMIELPNGLFRFIDAFPQGFRKGGKLIKKYEKYEK